MELSRQTDTQVTTHILEETKIFYMQAVWLMREESLKNSGRQIKIPLQEIF